MMMMSRAVTVSLAALTGAGASAALWGPTGHTMVAEAATSRLPGDMPAFFRSAAPQLRYLNPEPDRWRDREAPEMDGAFKFDHYIDLENVPAAALDAPNRYDYTRALIAAGVEDPAQDAGYLPYRIVELYQRLTSEFARWRNATTATERGWIQDRIINDAGVLGHYVADGANPHHTTIHYNGWAKDVPNPDGYTTERDFHWRFESQYVDAHVNLADIEAALPPGARVFDDVRPAVMDYIRTTNTQVRPLYELEKAHRFDDGPTTPEAQAFVTARLAAGADMLRDLWYTAWVKSEALAQREQ